MSKTFDALLQAERGVRLFGTALVDSEILETKPTCLGPQPGLVRRCVMRRSSLIERVFLFPGQQVPQVVVFCGIDGRGGTAGICARAGRNPAEQTGIPSLLDRCRP